MIAFSNAQFYIGSLDSYILALEFHELRTASQVSERTLSVASAQ